MLSIQELGQQILTGNPGKFYVLGGTEYGVKSKYLSILTDHFEGRHKEVTTVNELISLFSKKHFIPLEPTLYVVRYDESFISSLNDTLAKKIESLKVVGTIVVLYEDSKHVAKCDKYLPNCTGTIDELDAKYIKKYLTSDFPDLPSKFIDIAIEMSENYGHAKNICYSMKAADTVALSKMSDDELKTLFGHVNTSTESQVRTGVASRNFSALVKFAEQYPEDYDKILYIILQTMIELEKCKTSKYVESDIRNFANKWTFEDIYYMFVNTYEELKKFRTITVSDPMNSLIYLFGLLKYNSIPRKEAME